MNGRDPRYLTVALVCFVLALLCLSCLSCAATATGKALNAGVVITGVADVHSTRLAIDAGNGREGNPFMDHGPWVQGLIKAGGIGAVLAGALLIEAKGHPVVAHVLRAVTAGLWGIVAWRNYQIAGARH